MCSLPSEGVVERVERTVHKVTRLTAFVGYGIGGNDTGLVESDIECETYPFVSYRGSSVTQLDVLRARRGCLTGMFVEVSFRRANQSDGTLNAAVSGQKTPVSGV